MKGPFKAKKIVDDIYWVGAIDWGIRNFHGYETSRGTTYNAYLVMADKITLVDTVKAPFRDEFLSRVASVIDPEKIDIIISNHSEMDHSGNLMEAINLIKPEKVYLSANGEKAIRKHFHTDTELQVVKDGERISLGNMHVQFMETRMLHWPDSMFSYIEEKKLLFSQDAFGMHLASYERFDDQLDISLLEWEAAKYYANILLPFSMMVKNLIKKVDASGLEFDIVAPDHGPVWRKDFSKIYNWYSKWANQEATDKAVVVYDTMWHSTEVMARAIAEGLSDSGAKVKVLPLQGSHRSDVATEVLEAGALLVGAPTMNNNMFPSLGDVMTYLKGLKPLNLIGAAFGSYGWGGQSVGQLEEFLKEMKVELAVPGLKIQYVPDNKELEECYKLGRIVGGKLTRTLVKS